MAQSRTKPSTPRLSEVARQFKYPDGIITTGWPAVEAKAAEVGIKYDWWQQQAGKVTLGKRADGKYAATVGGIVLSVPRQVGKTFWVGSMLVMLCLLFPGLQVVWTAHRTRTSTRTFQALQRMVRRKKIWPHVAPDGIRKTNGEQEIRFRNDSVIMFGAREQGFGRGFDEIDVEVFDEAQILTDKALEDMVAATNQARHPHGALLFFIGTPPRPVDPGEAFTAKREQALAGDDGIFYLEFAADPNAKLDDHTQWAKANPSYPRRTPLESMLRLRKNLPSDGSWKREALGIWDAEGDRDPAAMPYPPDRLSACMSDDAPDDGASVAWSVDVSWDRSIAYVSKAALAADGTPLVRPVLSCDPSQVVTLLLPEVRKSSALGVAVQAAGAPVSSLIDSLRKALDGACDVFEMTGADSARACGMAYDAVKDGAVKRPADSLIDDANRQAEKRSLGYDGWVIDRKKSPPNVAALISWTNALWVLLTAPADADPGVWFV